LKLYSQKKGDAICSEESNHEHFTN
jgi:hypothetical protein